MTVQHSIAVESLLLNPKITARLEPVSEKPLPPLVREQGSTMNAVFNVISVFAVFNGFEIVGVGTRLSA